MTGTPPPGGDRASGDRASGDWASGERVFGPPTGTLDADWLVPVVREAVPAAGHADARAALVRVWAVLREESARRGCAPADVPEDAVRAALGLRTGTEAAHPDRSRPQPPVEVEGHLVRAALVAVRAAVRAYDAS